MNRYLTKGSRIQRVVWLKILVIVLMLLVLSSCNAREFGEETVTEETSVISPPDITNNVIIIEQEAKTEKVKTVASEKTVSKQDTPDDGNIAQKSELYTNRKYAASNLNVREQASTDSAVIGTLKVGEEVSVIKDLDSEWTLVDYNGHECYVASRYLLDIQSTATAGNEVYSYSIMENDLRSIMEKYPATASLSTLCTTTDGRHVYCLKIGAANPAYKILLTGAIHAREYLTTELVMKLVYGLLSNYDNNLEYNGITYSDILKDCCFYFIPMMNPDGVTISQFGVEGLNYEASAETVKNIALMDGGGSEYYYRHWKSNADGIDLNRQFDALWETYDDHVGHPSSDHYKGSGIGTAAEAKALIDLTNNESFDRTISYHTAGSVIYWYFGQEGEMLEKSKAFAERLSKTTAYPLDANYQSLDPAGYKDWAIIKKGIPSLTIEVGSGDSPLDHKQLQDIFIRNRFVLEEAYLSLFE